VGKKGLKVGFVPLSHNSIVLLFHCFSAASETIEQWNSEAMGQ